MNVYYPRLAAFLAVVFAGWVLVGLIRGHHLRKAMRSAAMRMLLGGAVVTAIAVGFLATTWVTGGGR